MAAMAAKFEEMLNSEITSLSGDTKENDISKGLEAVPVQLHSSIKTVKSFQYVTHVKCGPGVDIDFNQSMYPGCDCTSKCDETSCACIVRYGPSYDKQRCLLKIENSEGFCLPIFECNSSCRCPSTCTNRLSQQGMTVKLEVFQTSNRGLGVRARELIPKCHFITEYTGELISYKEAKRRTEVKRNDSESNFLLVLKEHVLMGNIFRTHIDATHYGNVARFINHSCEPNMVMFPVRHNSPVPKLCLFSSRAIDAGEELTFSYGETTYKNAENCQIGEKSPFSFETVRVKCLCANKNCAGYLPFDGYLYDV